jgi:hypothetical protein
MSELSKRQPPSVRIGAGIKVAALVFTLGAIALAADLAWMVPGHATVTVRTPATPEAPANESAAYRDNPALSTPPATEAGEHVQAF